MKKLISFIITFTLILAIFPTNFLKTSNGVDLVDEVNSKIKTTSFVTTATVDDRNEEGKYLILNEDGSYGGTLNEALYGKGAPYNGEFEIENSDYYTKADYYNINSTKYVYKSVEYPERTVIPKFSSYQQTMQDSSGLACILMILNYLGYDVSSEYSELNLVKAYEELNETTVYGNGTTPTGLVNFVNSLDLGITANATELGEPVEDDFEEVALNWIENCVMEGKFVLVRYQSPNGFGWKLIKGYDNTGLYRWSYTENYYTPGIFNDVLILAEPNDNYDHYQDGFSIARASNFITWWCNMSPNGTVSNKREYVVIDPNIDFEFERELEPETPYQELTDIYLPLNHDGFKGGVKYGGSRDTVNFGYITAGDGVTNNVQKPFYKITDFYNMGSEGSRLLLKNYTVLQQTMSSSCGVCAVNSVLKYYGYSEYDYFDLELVYTNLYDNHPDVDDVVRGGTSNGYHKIVLEDMGYTSHHYRSKAGEEPVFADYKSFVSFVKYNLKNDRPIVLNATPRGGHFITIIGYDDMGTDYIYDDVIIIADSSDSWDHYQDGYNIYSATQFYRQFANESKTYLQQCLVIYKN